MPIICITGQRCAGKHAVADWLCATQGFRRVTVVERELLSGEATDDDEDEGVGDGVIEVEGWGGLVEFATRHWRMRLVCVDVMGLDTYEVLSKRPFFLLVSVESGMLMRYARWRRGRPVEEGLGLDHFVNISDEDFYGTTTATTHTPNRPPPLQHIDSTTSITDTPTPTKVVGPRPGPRALLDYKASIRVINTFDTLDGLGRHLDTLDLCSELRLRPSWDAYFMSLASLASLRSNCMKRRVGCVLVRENRVVATGYNGTPRGVTNCNEGGCERCNSGTAGGVGLGTCLCLHAEENALLEAGRERISGGGGGKVKLYCNTCPCLTCSVKIAQVGVDEVVYNMAYSMDAATAKLLRSAGVGLRQYSPPYER
ncbi:Deoxycytidine monophosphate (dCMP) deaminase [Savitreella phatthalungensis]